LIVDEDCGDAILVNKVVARAAVCREDVEVVVVVAGDGEVPHPAVVLLRGGAAVSGGDGGVSGLEAFALLQLGGLNPLPARRSVD